MKQISPRLWNNNITLILHSRETNSNVDSNTSDKESKNIVLGANLISDNESNLSSIEIKGISRDNIE